MKTEIKKCKHEWEAHSNTRGTNPPIITATYHWCKKCGARKEPKTESEEQWDRWSDFVGEYR